MAFIITLLVTAAACVVYGVRKAKDEDTFTVKCRYCPSGFVVGTYSGSLDQWTEYKPCPCCGMVRPLELDGSPL
jgi:hypothetical protein